MEKKYTPEQIAAMYAENPATVISRKTGVKLNQIYKDLRKEGVEVRPRGHRPVLESPGKETLQELLSGGLSQREVGELIGVSKRTVQRWLK